MKPAKKKIILWGLTLVIAAFLGGVAFTWYQLSLDLNHRFDVNANDLPKPEVPYKNVSLRTSDNINIAGWYIPAENPKAAVIVVHGYTSGKSEMLAHADYLHEAGYSALLIDLRGNGESGGDRVTLGIEEWKDLEAAYDYMKSLPENNNKKIGFLGDSMGASTSIIAVGKTGKGDFVVALVPYADYARLFGFQADLQGFGLIPGVKYFAVLAANFAIKPGYQQLSPGKMIKNIHAPVLIVWSEKDEEVGPDQGSHLFQIANPPKEEWEASAGHDVMNEDSEGLKKRVLEFLEKYAKMNL